MDFGFCGVFVVVFGREGWTSSSNVALRGAGLIFFVHLAVGGVRMGVVMWVVVSETMQKIEGNGK